MKTSRSRFTEKILLSLLISRRLHCKLKPSATSIFPIKVCCIFSYALDLPKLIVCNDFFELAKKCDRLALCARNFLFSLTFCKLASANFNPCTCGTHVRLHGVYRLDTCQAARMYRLDTCQAAQGVQVGHMSGCTCWTHVRLHRVYRLDTCQGVQVGHMSGCTGYTGWTNVRLHGVYRLDTCQAARGVQAWVKTFHRCIKPSFHRAISSLFYTFNLFPNKLWCFRVCCTSL